MHCRNGSGGCYSRDGERIMKNGTPYIVKDLVVFRRQSLLYGFDGAVARFVCSEVRHNIVWVGDSDSSCHSSVLVFSMHAMRQFHLANPRSLVHGFARVPRFLQDVSSLGL